MQFKVLCFITKVGGVTKSPEQNSYNERNDKLWLALEKEVTVMKSEYSVG